MLPLDLWKPVVFDDPGRHPQEAAFLHSILDNPDDDASRLVFADWLDDQGQADKARFVRLEVELSRLPRLHERFPASREELERLEEVLDWRWCFPLLRPGRLLNCGLAETVAEGLEAAGQARDALAFRFAYECPNRWADLRSTEVAGVRYCEECQKDVHFCASREEAEQHTLQGDCIAISSRVALGVLRERGEPPPALRVPDDSIADERLVMGEGEPPLRPYEQWAREMFNRHRKPWWQLWR